MGMLLWSTPPKGHMERLIPDLLQLRILNNHEAGRAEHVEHIEMICQAVQVNLSERSIVRMLSVLVPLLPLESQMPFGNGDALSVDGNASIAPAEVARAWAALLRAPGHSRVVEQDVISAEQQQLYMRLVHLGAAQITLSYQAGNGELTRLIDSLLEAERVVMVDDDMGCQLQTPSILKINLTF